MHLIDDSYPEVTPESIALLQLNDCARLLRQWEEYPLRLVQAAKAAHLALHAALTAALAGSANIGVFRESLRKDWLKYLNDPDDDPAGAPTGDFVLSFRDLYSAAKEGHPHGWLQAPLPVSFEENEQVERLAFVRACFEHPKPGTHYFEPGWVAAAIPINARLALHCLEAVWHHLEPPQQQAARADVVEIEALCVRVGRPS